MNPLETIIVEKLTQGLQPSHLEVLNESSKHNVPKNSETHFKIVLVSEIFTALPLIERHRKVQALLAEEWKKGLHALALHTYTPEEWTAKQSTPQTPLCRGGEK